MITLLNGSTINKHERIKESWVYSKVSERTQQIEYARLDQEVLLGRIIKLEKKVVVVV